MTVLQHINTHLALSGVEHERAPGEHTGIIVALRVPPAVAAHLAVPGGESEAELHVTLAFLGSSDDLTPADQRRYANYSTELAALAARTAPLDLRVTGAGSFPNAQDGQAAHYLDVDAPGLRALREEVMTLAEHAGLTPSRKFPTFHPHVTLSYSSGPHPDPHPATLSFTVPQLELWAGGRHWLYPLRGHERPATMSKAAQAPAPQDAARALLARLTGDLIHIQRDERKARQRTDALAQHHAHATERLGQIIRAPRDSALEEAFLDHANEARAARALAAQ